MRTVSLVHVCVAVATGTWPYGYGSAFSSVATVTCDNGAWIPSCSRFRIGSGCKYDGDCVVSPNWPTPAPDVLGIYLRISVNTMFVCAQFGRELRIHSNFREIEYVILETLS